ncbi:MAG TPA: ABC transporter permease [Alkalispirochaeta sp.]|nr:ABC transporter permease [Alkalispirochaeta sp.]
MRRRATSTVGGLAGVVAFWWGLSAVLGATLIPSPATVAAVLWALLVEGSIFRHAGASLLRLMAGIGAAVLVGVPVGILSGVSSRADRLISPVVYVLYPLPKIAFLPVFMVLFGLGDLSKIVLLVAVIFFQLVLSARDGVRGIPRELHYAAATLKLDGIARFRRLYLPSALPQVFSAVRISVGIGIAVLFLAENYATTYGMGYFIMNNWVMINYPRMFAGIVALGVLAAAVLSVIDVLERHVCRWLYV